MSDKNTAPFLLVQDEARLFSKDSLVVIARVARVADHTRSYLQINGNKLLATAARYISDALSMQLKLKNSCTRARNTCQITNRGY